MTPGLASYIPLKPKSSTRKKRSWLAISRLPRPLMRSGCIPCLMPFIDSQFMPRRPGDRPRVVPPGASNFAFIGQFAEVADDCVFTVEYAVRTAQTAVYALLGMDKEALPIYQGHHDVQVLVDALNATRR